MRVEGAHWLAAFCIATVCGAPRLMANQPPVANAGPDRYLDAQPLTLDAGASFDPDPGDAIVSYAWTQISGPALNITNPNTATPTVTATPVANAIGTAILHLVVNDGEIDSPSDSIQLTIVAAVPPSIQMTLMNPPFDVNKPTAVFFGGGNCVTGGGPWEIGPEWEALVNVIGFDYGPPYDRPADALIAYLSRVAPTYNRAIQTAGFSTGGMPAMDSAIRLNKIFNDPRYAVSIVNLLDGACRNYEAGILDFISNPVGDRPAFVQNFYSTTAGSATFRARAINVAMEGPHNLPVQYYIFSLYPSLFTTDVYNHGIVGGAFTSLPQHGANYRIPNLPGSPYFFRLVFDTPETLHLEHVNAGAYPGRLPEPIDLAGPANGELAPIGGVTLGCTPSENSVAYDVLIGPDPDQLTIEFISPAPPVLATGLLPPGETFFWAVQARDSYAASYRANVRSFTTPAGNRVDIDGNGEVDGDDCGVLQAAFGSTWGDAAFHRAADYDGNGDIDCVDYVAWLADYRAYYGDPQRPDPCGLTLTPDSDDDGVVDSCDACASTVPGSPVDEYGCPPHIPGDFDRDGDVDLTDFGRFQVCLGSIAPVASECLPADLDTSGTVNAIDTTRFLPCLSGPDIPANPACAD